MVKTKHIIIAIVVIAIVWVGWYLLSPIFRVVEVDEASPLGTTFEEAMEESSKIVMEKMEDMPADLPTVSAQADFVPGDHDVEGRALLIESGGKKYVRFEDFETINGPNLHIYLSADLEAGDFVDLGAIKATRGNVNYEIPVGVDTSRYNKVLVWCVPFKVLFSYAVLK